MVWTSSSLRQVGQGHGGLRQVGGRSLAVSRVGEPVGHPGNDGSGPDPLDDHLGGEEALLDELPQGHAELLLALHYDGRVGDGQAQRSAEQGGHREPVGQTADQCCLGRGLDVARP
jgi:hypothetical protein